MKSNFLKLAFAGIITICLLTVCGYVLHSKSWYPSKMDDFYAAPADYDVWFFGTSHAIMSTLPEEMYREYGIRSYNMASYGQTMAVDYWVARNLIKVAKPKLIVMDIHDIGRDEKYSENNISTTKAMVSFMPFGMEKYAMINDLFEGDLKEEMLFPFASDHYNWEYLSENNFVSEPSYELGAQHDGGQDGETLVTPAAMTAEAVEVSFEDPETVSSRYLLEMDRLCRDNGIQLLLVKCPLSVDGYFLKEYSKAFLFGEEYGIPGYNGFDDISEYDGDTDLYDSSHLNSKGARTYTHLLGKYIADNYPQISGKAADAEMEKRWTGRYEKYLASLDDGIRKETDLYSYLMLCTHPRYKANIEIKNGSICDDAVVSKLADAISKDKEPVTVDEAEHDIHVTVYDEDGNLIDDAFFVYNHEVRTGGTREGVPDGE